MRLTGFRDNWHICWQFNRAVGTFGRYISNKLLEHDDKFKPLHTIDSLLGIKRHVVVQTKGARVIDD